MTPTFMRVHAFPSFLRFASLSSFLRVITLQFLLLILIAGESRAVRPYHPVHPDPVLESWRWQSFPELKGLGLECLAEDLEGNMWFGTGEGVRCYDGLKWRVYTSEDGVYGRPVMTLCAARDGSVYAGTGQGISRFAEGTWRRIFPPEGDLSWPVYQLRQVSDGSVWAATERGALCLGSSGATLYTDRGNGAAIRGMAPYVRVVCVPDAATPVYPWPKDAPVGALVTAEGVIRAVAAGGPEEAAGLKPGDRITAVDGDPEVTATRLDAPAGVSVRLTVEREGHPDRIEVVPVRRPVEATYRDFRVSDILEDREGAIWIGLYPGEVVRFDRGGDEEEAGCWRLHTAADGLEAGFRPRLAQSRDRAIWVVSDPGNRGVSRFDGRTWMRLRLRDYGGFDNHTSILTTGDGTLWVGGKFALHALREGEWRVYRSEDLPIPSHRVRLLRASDGALWMAGLGQEAVRLDYGPVDELRGPELPVRDARRGAVVRVRGQRGGATSPGNVGALRRGGRADGGAPRALSHAGGGGVGSGQPRPHRGHGAVRWRGVDTPVASRSGVVHLEGGLRGIGWIALVRGVSSDPGRAAPRGLAPVGCPSSRRLGACAERNGGSAAWTHYLPPEAPVVAYGLGQTAGGIVWAGGWDLRRFDGRVWERCAQPEELSVPFSDVVYAAPDGALWVGHRTYGAFRFDGERWTHFDVRDGLADNGVVSFLQTDDGSVWAATAEGVSRFDGRSWTARTLPAGLRFGRNSTLLQSGDGAIWMNWNTFSDPWRAQSLRAIRYEPDRHPPETMIGTALERVSQPGNTTMTWTGADVWRRTPDEDLEYAWCLSGGEWSAFSADRSCFLEALPGGEHTFEVKARDRDFNEDPTPARVRFTVVPPVWREPWFLLMVAGFVGVTGFQASRIVIRDRKLRQANNALSEANKELFGLNRELDGSNRALKNEMAERERLDAQLQHLRYLYRLRSVLGTARSAQDVIRRAGEALMEVLAAVDSSGVVIEHDGRSWSFGSEERNGKVHYKRPLAWGERERGHLHLFSGIELSESQERALLDETAGQISRVLEARELELQILQSARLVSLGEMAAGVAHELGQPLTVIETTAGDICSRLIEDIDLPLSELKEMMQDVREVVDRMAGTIRHLRVFSRDGSEEPRRAFQVNDAVRDSLKMIGAQLDGHGIDLILDLGEDLPAVWGHPHPMEQVFLNLLSNARDALDERAAQAAVGNGGDEKRLRVRTRMEFYGGRWVVVEVEDNGIGMDETDRRRVFEPFFTTKEAGRGTGLGLSISYAIVQNHGGRISCESRRGAGTVFRVALPVSEREG